MQYAEEDEVIKNSKLRRMDTTTTLQWSIPIRRKTIAVCCCNRTGLIGSICNNKSSSLFASCSFATSIFYDISPNFCDDWIRDILYYLIINMPKTQTL